MKFSHSLLHKSKAYWLVLGLFAAANLYSWFRDHLIDPACCDQLVARGFPFPFHVSGGIAGRSEMLITGLLLDVVVAWTLAVCAAWVGLIIRRRRSGNTG